MMLARRRIRPRKGPREIGRPCWHELELGRVRGIVRHRRQAERRRIARRAGPWALLAALTAALVPWGGGLDWHVLAALAVGSLVVVMLGRPGVASTMDATRPWEQWAQGRRELVEVLREVLDDQWVILWDRSVDGWQVPVTLVVGPPGRWALWAVDPGMAPARAAALQEAVSQALRVTVGAMAWEWRPHPPGKGWAEVVTRIALERPRLSEMEIQAVVATVESRSLPASLMA